MTLCRETQNKKASNSQLKKTCKTKNKNAVQTFLNLEQQVTAFDRNSPETRAKLISKISLHRLCSGMYCKIEIVRITSKTASTENNFPKRDLNIIKSYKGKAHLLVNRIIKLRLIELVMDTILREKHFS